MLACLVPYAGWGCYAYTYHVSDRPVPGTTIEVTLNDLGRLSMAQNIGPEVLRVEGTVATATDSLFILRVHTVTGIDQSIHAWAREPVTFQYAYVRGLREKRFSSGRTAMLAGGMSAGVVALMATASLLGLGSEGRGPGSTDPPGGIDH